MTEAFEHFARALPDPVLIVTPAGRILAVNRVAGDLLEGTIEELRSKSLQDLVEEPAEKVADYLRRCARTRQPLPGGLTLRCNGELLPIRAHGARVPQLSESTEPALVITLRPRRDAAHRFVLLNEQVDALSREIMRRKHVESMLDNERQWLRITLASIGDGVIATDCDGCITFMNVVAEQLTGWTADEALGKPIVEVFRIIDAVTGHNIDNPCDLVIKGNGETMRLAANAVLIGRDGVQRRIEDSAAPIRDHDNTLIGVVLVFQDVTERRRAEAEAMEAQERLRFTLQATGVGTWDWDMITDQVIWSDNLEALHGQPSGSFANCFEAFVEHVHPDDRGMVNNAIQQAIDGEGTFDIEYRFHRADGTTGWAGGKGKVVKSGDGHTRRLTGICFDITDRKHAQEELRQQHEWLHTTLASIGDAVIATDAQGRVTFMNPVAEALTGWSVEDARGVDSVTVFDIINEDTRLKVESPIERVLREGVVVGLANHTLLIARDGVERPIDDSGAPIRDSEGNIVGVVLVFHDISERKRSEDALRESAARMQAVVETAVDGIITINDQGIIESMNSAVERIFGYTRDELVGANVKVLMPSPYREEHDQYLVNYLETGERKIIGIGRSVTGLRKNGTSFPMELAVSEFVQGGQRMFTGIVRDVTHRTEAEQALRESEQRFRFMADAAPVMIWVADTTKACTYFNKQWLDYTGRTMEQEVGDGWTQGLHPDDYDHCVSTYSGAFDRRESFRMEYRLRSASGDYHWFLDNGLPRYSPDGTFAGYIGSCIDITDRREYESRLRALNEELEQRVRERTRVAERRAEQLRALTFELTQAEQRERRRLAHTLHDHLQQILVVAKMRLGMVSGRIKDAESAELLSHVDDLLMQSIDASRSLTVELSPPILYDGGLIPALHWLARRMQDKHDLSVDIKVKAAKEPSLEDVRVILFQAVRELVFNAVKHAGVDRVELTIDNGQDEHFIVEVADEGRGFDLRTIEEPNRAAESFGLFNIRERLDVLGGRLLIDSEPGKGTRVTISAPIEPGRSSTLTGVSRQSTPDAPLAPQAERRKPDSSDSALRVLLADDHKILREGLVSLLRAQPDIEVVGEASDGAMAVEMARELKPDVIVMDVSMPEMNGVEATRVITSELPSVRIVGLSMHEEQDMASAMRRAGAVAYLPKDGPSNALIDAIRG